MATSSEPRSQAYTAGEDLSSKQYHFVKFGADDQTVLAAGLNERAIGILQNAPGSGERADVALQGGGSKLKVSEAVSPGKLLTPQADGKGEVVDAADEWHGAVAMETAAADGDIIGVEVVLGLASASDA